MKKKKIIVALLSIFNLGLLGSSVFLGTRYYLKQKEDSQNKRISILKETKKTLNEDLMSLKSILITYKESLIKDVEKNILPVGNDNIFKQWVNFSWLLSKSFKEMKEFETNRQKDEFLEINIETMEDFYYSNTREFKYSPLSVNKENEKLFIINFLKNYLNLENIDYFIENVFLAQEKGRLYGVAQEVLEEIFQEMNENEYFFNQDPRVIKIRKVFNSGNLFSMIEILNSFNRDEIITPEMRWAFDLKEWITNLNVLEKDLKEFENSIEFNHEKTDQFVESFKEKISKLKAPLIRLKRVSLQVNYVSRIKNYFNFILETIKDNENVLNQWNQDYLKNRANDLNYYKNFMSKIEYFVNNIESFSLSKNLILYKGEQK